MVTLGMSACVLEEGRDEGGGVESANAGEMIERPRREVLLSARGRRACSEQGPQAAYLRKHILHIIRLYYL